MMEPDQRAAYQAWLNAGAQGSPPAWVMVDRQAEARRQAEAQAATAAVQQAGLAHLYDLDGTGYGSAVQQALLAEPEPAAPAPDAVLIDPLAREPEPAAPTQTLSAGSSIVPAYDSPSPVSPADPQPVIKAATAPAMTLAPMTADAYAASRPDLIANWDRAWNDPAHATSAIGEWIRSFGSLEAYLENDYGKPFYSSAANSTVVLPPVIVTGSSVNTGNPVITQPTGNTGVTTLVSSNDTDILGGIDQWLKTLSNAASALSGAQAAANAQPTTTSTTTAAPGMSTGVKVALAVLAIGGGILVIRAARRR